MNDTKDCPRRLYLGDPFPQIKVQTTYGPVMLPDDYKGQWFILFSHPGDFTPVCTTEFVSFQLMYPYFQQLNTCLIGLSIDQVQPHIKWVEWIQQYLGVQITFPIIADPLGKVADQLGLVNPEKQVRTVRGVYIVDDKGIIRAILYYPAEVGRNMQEIYRLVCALQTSDANKVALPSDWPNNSIIGDKGILPPADTVQKANERILQSQSGEIECFDWWFCFKSLQGLSRISQEILPKNEEEPQS